MQTLRFQSDMSSRNRRNDALGRDAGALGRRVLAAAQAAAAMHLAETTRLSLTGGRTPRRPNAEDPR